MPTIRTGSSLGARVGGPGSSLGGALGRAAGPRRDGEAILNPPGPRQRGWIRLIPPKPDPALDLFLTGKIVPPGGYGGFQSAPRTDQTELLDWVSGQTLVHAVPVLLEGIAHGTHVQREFDALEKLMRRPDGSRPPRLRVEGPLRHADLAYVIDGVDERRDEQCPATDQADRLVRWAGTLYLRHDPRQDVTGQRLPSPEEANRDKPHTYTVVKGDTYRSIAGKALGRKSRWKEIADANNDENPHPDRALTPGATIVLPNAKNL